MLGAVGTAWSSHASLLEVQQRLPAPAARAPSGPWTEGREGAGPSGRERGAWPVPGVTRGGCARGFSLGCCQPGQGSNTRRRRTSPEVSEREPQCQKRPAWSSLHQKHPFRPFLWSKGKCKPPWHFLRAALSLASSLKRL